jgi:AsmA protein
MPRIILIVFGALIVLLVGALFVVPSLIPTDVYRAQIESRATDALGRQVEIAGPVKVSVLPTLQARAQSVTIANAEGFDADAFVQVEELRARLALWPLLSRRVEINEFVLMRPQIALEVDSAGRNNWTFGSEEPSAPRSADGFTRRPGALPFEAALGNVRIVEGAASYTDRAAGREHAVTDLNLTVKMPSLSEPLHVDGAFDLDGDPVRLEARLDSLRSFFDGQTAPFFLDVDAGVLTVEADGRFEADQALSFSGDVRMASSDLKALAAKAGVTLPEGDVYRSFDVRGHAAGDAERISFEQAELAFDDIRGSGQLVADLSGARPFLSGELAMGDLDVTPYIPAGGGPAGEESGAPGAGGGIPPWSETPINFEPLKAIDADLRMSATALKAQSFAFGESRLRARLQNGRLQIDAEEIDAYEGAGTAEVVVDASGATPQLSLSADLADLQAQPFLVAAADFNRLTGIGGGRVNLAGAGRSPAEIMASLDGSGGFDFKNGAIHGVNIAAAIRGLEALRQGQLDLAAFGSTAQTDFTDLIGQFTVENGVATIGELRLSSPLVRVTGSGSLNIAEQTVDLRLEPRAVASIEGQGGASDLSGLGIPLRISGSWGAVKAGVDEEALQRLAAQEAAGALTDDAAGAIDDALGAGASDLLRGALGLPAPAPSDAQPSGEPQGESAEQPPADQAAEEEQQEDPAEQLLRSIFGDPD